MKKIIIIITISFLIAFIFFLFVKGEPCILEKEITHNTAVPIVKSLSKYAKENGIPKSFKEVKDFPYKLKSCSEKTDIKVCEVLKDGYYFIKDGKYYSVRLWLYPFKNSPKGFGLDIIHNTTHCSYDIYQNNELKKNYSEAVCSLTCKGGLRQ